MDEIKIIFWIIIGLVYLFSRRKKSQATPPPARRSEEMEPGYDTPAPKAVTFEDLLREIQGMKKPEPSSAPPAPVNDYGRPPVKKEYEIEPFYRVPETKQIEDVNYDYRTQDKIYDIYDNATKQAFARPSLEETMKLDDTIVRFKQFKGYENKAKESFLAEYIKELKDPKGFKRAFIMSEIINRRF